MWQFVLFMPSMTVYRHGFMALRDSRQQRTKRHDHGPANSPECGATFPGRRRSVKLQPGAATGHLADAMGGMRRARLAHKAALGGTPALRNCLTCNADLPTIWHSSVPWTWQCGRCHRRRGRGYLTAAVTGDLLAGMARNCGVAAIVTDGTVRDMAAF